MIQQAGWPVATLPFVRSKPHPQLSDRDNGVGVHSDAGPAGPADCICGPQGAEAFGRYQRQYGAGIFGGIWMWIYGLSGMMRLEDCLKASVPQRAPLKDIIEDITHTDRGFGGKPGLQWRELYR